MTSAKLLIIDDDSDYLEEMLTMMQSTGYEVEALRGKADDYLEKPLKIEKAKKIITGLLDKAINPNDILDEDTEGKIERIKRLVERNYDKKVTLNDAAEKVGLSPKYLSRLFKETVGMDYSQYRLNFKIKDAKEKLIQTGKSISQISDELGYQNLETFIRMFKHATKLTPAAFRLKHKKKSKQVKSIAELG